jgi:hypothetical protein
VLDIAPDDPSRLLVVTDCIMPPPGKARAVVPLGDTNRTDTYLQPLNCSVVRSRTRVSTPWR